MPFTITPTHKEAYGCKFNLEIPDWLIELRLYANNEEYSRKGRVPGLLPKWKHFVNAAEILFGPTSKEPFIWHPWAIKMIKACCQYQYVGFAGSSSCGKSQFLGIWLLLNFLADFRHTLCYATSKSLRESKTRIWAAVKSYYEALPEGIDGVICVYLEHPTPQILAIRNGKRQANAGIQLIPADSSQSNTKTNKLQGAKAYGNKQAPGRMFLGGDEFDQLSHALVATMLSNLSNNPTFHAIAAANPDDKFDPFGHFVKPKYGWASIHVDMEQWETANGGVCLHFDALKNPNYKAKKNLWPIQPWEKVEAAIEEAGGDNTPKFWRFCRAFWPPAGISGSAGIYSDLEITQNGNDNAFTDVHSDGENANEWDPNYELERWGGVDTAFAEGGDRCILMIGDKGVRKGDGREIINLVKYHEITADTNITDVSIERQIAKKIVQLCDENDVSPDNLGVDATGAGNSFCTILAEERENNDFYKCYFSGAATERPVSDLDETPSNQKYANRSTEMWFYGKELIRHGQLWNIKWIPLQSELTSRRHTTRKNSNGFPVVQNENKKDLRRRTTMSPDIADAMFIMLDTIRERKGIKQRMTVIQNDNRGPQSFLKFVQSRNVTLKANRRLVW
jgi:hypothetical protein